MENLKKYIKGDKVIWAVVILLSLFSILSVYSATGSLAYRYKSGNTEYYLLKHFITLLFGLGLMYLAHLIKYTYYSRVSGVFLLVSIPLLILTLIIGTNIHEASRWLTLPVVGISFQTSDIAKLALIIYVARTLAKKQKHIKEFRNTFLPVIIPIIFVCGLILPANFSTASVLFMTCVFLMYIGRIKTKHLLALIGSGAVLLSLFIFILINSQTQGRVNTWKNRVESFISEKDRDNYQVDQAKMAIAKGGIINFKPGSSTQKNFLPHPYSDFIYAIIIEEYGMTGGLLILLFYLILLFRSIRIVTKSPGTFATFVVMGCCFNLVFQAMINMAVAVNLIPVTGQSLPLISMGGTSILFTSIAIGIILSVSRSIENDEKPAAKTLAWKAAG